MTVQNYFPLAPVMIDEACRHSRHPYNMLYKTGALDDIIGVDGIVLFRINRNGNILARCAFVNENAGPIGIKTIQLPIALLINAALSPNYNSRLLISSFLYYEDYVRQTQLSAGCEIFPDDTYEKMIAPLPYAVRKFAETMCAVRKSTDLESTSKEELLDKIADACLQLTHEMDSRLVLHEKEDAHVQEDADSSSEYEDSSDQYSDTGTETDGSCEDDNGTDDDVDEDDFSFGFSTESSNLFQFSYLRELFAKRDAETCEMQLLFLIDDGVGEPRLHAEWVHRFVISIHSGHRTTAVRLSSGRMKSVEDARSLVDALYGRSYNMPLEVLCDICLGLRDAALHLALVNCIDCMARRIRSEPLCPSVLRVSAGLGRTLGAAIANAWAARLCDAVSACDQDRLNDSICKLASSAIAIGDVGRHSDAYIARANLRAFAPDTTKLCNMESRALALLQSLAAIKRSAES